jgi:hypothetical protein
MAHANCTGGKHTWPVHTEAGRLITAALRHGHACACGRFVVALVECNRGCRHKRVVAKSDFDKLMKENA